MGDNHKIQLSYFVADANGGLEIVTVDNARNNFLNANGTRV